MIFLQPAAFGRLCVETHTMKNNKESGYQPPSGGCVLKLNNEDGLFKMKLQPPSGGCVLKRKGKHHEIDEHLPAAFGRLCVETVSDNSYRKFQTQPPSGGCVLKLNIAVHIG